MSTQQKHVTKSRNQVIIFQIYCVKVEDKAVMLVSIITLFLFTNKTIFELSPSQ